MDFNHDTSTIDVSGVTGQTLNISGNGALLLPAGLDASRPANAAGKFRWNTTSNILEVNNGSAWKNIQFQSANLDGLTSVSTTGIEVRTGSGTYTTRQIAVPGSGNGMTITNADGVAGNPTLAFSDDLAALEGLSTTAFAVRTGVSTWTTRTISGTGSNISVSGGDGSANVVIDLINTGSVITDSFVRITTDTKGRVTASNAVSNANIVASLGYTPLNRAGDALTAGDLTLFQDPTSPMHAATKQYVDQRAAGLDPKGSVRAASSATNYTISNPGTAIFGGVTLTTGDRVLLKDQTAPSENGIYIFNGSASALTRSTDADTNAKVTSGLYVFVTEGTAAAQGWILTTPDPITLGTTGLTFAQFNGGTTYTANNGIAINGSIIQTDSTSLLRGLHTLASNGILVKTGSNTATNRSIAVPAAGLSITNADGVAGNPTLALANDLAGLEGLAGTGFATRTTTDTWAQRTMTGTANQITVTNGDGVAGAPTFAITNDAVLPGNIGMVVPSGTTAQETGTTDGGLRFDNQALRLRQRYNGSWKNVGAGDGTVTSVNLTTSTSGLTVGGGPVTSSGALTVALSSELQGIHAGMIANGILVRTAAGTYTTRTTTSGTGINISNADGVSGNITISNTGVTSVGLSLPAELSVTTATVTTTGTLTASWATQTTNKVFASPNGSTGAPTFRTLAYADLPIKLLVENPSTPTAPTAAGANAVAIGSGSTAPAAQGIAIGDGSAARIQGQSAQSNGKFATVGDAQFGEYVLRNQTTDATTTELFIDGSAVRLALPNNSAFLVTVHIVARQTNATGGSAAYKHEFLITRDATAATTAIIGNVSTNIFAETNSAWSTLCAADATNGSIKVTVTGEAAKTIRWVAKVSTVEVTN